MFFEDKPGPHSSIKPQSPHLYRAFLLKGAINRCLRLTSTRYSLTAWATELQVLEKEVGGRRLDAALNWFCENVGKPGVPRAMGGRSFRKAFGMIEDAMRQDKKAAAASAPHPMAAAVMAQITHLHWPNAAEDDLLTFVDLSLKAYTKFRAAVRSLKTPTNVRVHFNPSGGTVYTAAPQPTPFANWLKEYLPGSAQFGVQWCNTVYEGLKTWEDRSSSIVAWAWKGDPHNERTKAWGRRLADAHCDDSRVWDLFVRKYPQVFDAG